MVLEIERKQKTEEKEEEEEEEEEKRRKKKITGMEFEYGYMFWVVWKLWEYGSLVLGLESLDTWFRTLYLVYGLGVGTPKLIS